jgi:hypothetical protein
MGSMTSRISHVIGTQSGSRLGSDGLLVIPRGSESDSHVRVVGALLLLGRKWGGGKEKQDNGHCIHGWKRNREDVVDTLSIQRARGDVGLSRWPTCSRGR